MICKSSVLVTFHLWDKHELKEGKVLDHGYPTVLDQISGKGMVTERTGGAYLMTARKQRAEQRKK